MTAEENAAAQEKWAAEAETGPYAFIHLRPKGMVSDPMGDMLRGLLIEILAASLIAYVLLQLRDSTYWKRVGIATMFGVFAATVGSLLSWNYMGISAIWTVHEGLDHIACWFVTGLVIARFTRPE